MRFSVKTDIGKVRQVNEDCYDVITDFSDHFIALMIADGMGGHNAGEIASKLAVDTAGNYIRNHANILSAGDKILTHIHTIMKEANDMVLKGSTERETHIGMGTTMIVAVAQDQTMYIGHVGDSRVYLIRSGQAQRITTDHSYVEELVKLGTLTREEAEHHPKKNLITRALGGSEDVEVDTYTCEIQEGDRFILCTDGLTNRVSENEMSLVVMNENDPKTACEELVLRANQQGGEDNITVIIVQY